MRIVNFVSERRKAHYGDALYVYFLYIYVYNYV